MEWICGSTQRGKVNGAGERLMVFYERYLKKTRIGFIKKINHKCIRY